MAFEQVGVVQLLQRVYLALQHFLLRFALNRPDVYHFDCHLLLCFIVGAAIDHRTEASADDVFKAV